MAVCLERVLELCLCVHVDKCVVCVRVLSVFMKWNTGLMICLYTKTKLNKPVFCVYFFVPVFILMKFSATAVFLEI